MAQAGIIQLNQSEHAINQREKTSSNGATGTKCPEWANSNINSMKQQIRFIYLSVFAFLGMGNMCSFGQATQTDPIPNWQRAVNKVLFKEKSSYVFKDSIAMYTYNFKLKITKSKDDKSMVRQLLVSDSLLHDLFPNYKEFYSINFNSLLGKRREVNLVIPVLVFNLSPTGQSYYKRQDGQPLVSITYVMETMQRLLVSLVPNNNFEDEVLLEPVVIQILNLRGKEAILRSK